MFSGDSYSDDHERFGIDEVYIHKKLELSLLKKLQQRAERTLDSSDTIIKKNLPYDMIAMSRKGVPNQNMMYRFLEFLKSNPQKERDFQKYHTLLNEEELFDAIKSEKFLLLTTRDLSTPNSNQL